MNEGQPEYHPFESAPEKKESLRNTTEMQPTDEKTLRELYIEALMEHFDANPVDVLPKAPKVTAAELLERYPEAAQIVACDFSVEGAEAGTLITGGIQFGNITNIDHHADIESMKKYISSTNLAIEYVKANGVVPPDVPVVVNHVDADSFMSACLVRGFISPQQIYGEAAIAADHTGQPNEIADFFNPMDQIKLKGNEKFRYILKNWLIHLFDAPDLKISSQTVNILEQAEKDREEARSLAESGVFTKTDSGIYWINLNSKLESSYFAANLPDANLIVLFSPNKDNPGKTEVKIRLGNAAPKGFDIQKLGINEFDLGYGGRWNAGSNSRAGGTEVPIEEYIENLEQRTAKLLTELEQK